MRVFEFLWGDFFHHVLHPAPQPPQQPLIPVLVIAGTLQKFYRVLFRIRFNLTPVLDGVSLHQYIIAPFVYFEDALEHFTGGIGGIRVNGRQHDALELPHQLIFLEFVDQVIQLDLIWGFYEALFLENFVFEALLVGLERCLAVDQHAADFIFKLLQADVAFDFDPPPDTGIFTFQVFALADSLLQTVARAHDAGQEHLLHFAHLLAPVVVLLQGLDNVRAGVVDLPGLDPASSLCLALLAVEGTGDLDQLFPDLSWHVRPVLRPLLLQFVQLFAETRGAFDDHLDGIFHGQLRSAPERFLDR